MQSTTLDLNEDTLHIWHTTLTHLTRFHDFFYQTLEPDEIQRANQYVFPQHIQNFIMGRGFLRYTLSRYLGISAKDIKFVYAKKGKPTISAEQNKLELQFNISHSQDGFVLALCKKCDVGVDIEYIRPDLDFLEMAKRFFSTEEYQILNNLPSQQQAEKFFWFWTRKEAWAKAMGEGLGTVLSQNVSSAIDSFYLKNLSLAEGYQAAVACSKKPTEIDTYYFTEAT